MGGGSVPTIAAASANILVVQICGQIVPPDGAADLALFLWDLDAAGYGGAIECEVFWDQMGQPEPEGLLDRAVRDFLALTRAA